MDPSILFAKVFAMKYFCLLMWGSDERKWKSGNAVRIDLLMK